MGDFISPSVFGDMMKIDLILNKVLHDKTAYYGINYVDGQSFVYNRKKEIIVSDGFIKLKISTVGDVKSIDYFNFQYAENTKFDKPIKGRIEFDGDTITVLTCTDMDFMGKERGVDKKVFIGYKFSELLFQLLLNNQVFYHYNEVLISIHNELEKIK